MTRPDDERRSFWEQKIVGWEDQRYAARADSGPWLERVAHALSASVRFRFELARARLAPHVRGKRVVELGCGTGRLALPLLEAGAREYLGFDIAGNAVAAANARFAAAGCSDRAEARVLDMADLGGDGSLDADVIVSLGLLDWLRPEEITRVLRAGGAAHVLHSFSEERASIPQRIHRAYVHVAYGHRTRGYVPLYHRASFLMGMLADHPTGLHVERDARLSFGAFLTSLPAHE